jgi:hypothetical protein
MKHLKLIAVLLCLGLLMQSCTATRLPNGRKIHQGCQQGKQW